MTPEQYNSLPEEVLNTLATFDENEELYKEAKRIQLELLAIGHNCDYDLSGEITEVWEA